jgi:hypothetical protein
MRKDNDIEQPKPNIKVSSKILPFGSISVEIIGLPVSIEETKSDNLEYERPLTTGILNGELLFHYQSEETYIALENA